MPRYIPFEEILPGTRLVRSQAPLDVRTRVSKLSCATLCTISPICLSFNYCANRICELHAVDINSGYSHITIFRRDSLLKDRQDNCTGKKFSLVESGCLSCGYASDSGIFLQGDASSAGFSGRFLKDFSARILHHNHFSSKFLQDNHFLPDS